MYLLNHVCLVSNSTIYPSLAKCFIITNLRLDKVVSSIVGKVFSLIKVKVFEFFKIRNITNKFYYTDLRTFRDTIAVTIHFTDYIIVVTHFIDLIVVASFKLVNSTKPFVVSIIKGFFASFVNNIIIKVMVTFALVAVIIVFFNFYENVFFIVFNCPFFLRPFLVLFYVFELQLSCVLIYDSFCYSSWTVSFYFFYFIISYSFLF